MRIPISVAFLSLALVGCTTSSPDSARSKHEPLVVSQEEIVRWCPAFQGREYKRFPEIAGINFFREQSAEFHVDLGDRCYCSVTKEKPELSCRFTSKAEFEKQLAAEKVKLGRAMRNTDQELQKAKRRVEGL